MNDTTQNNKAQVDKGITALAINCTSITKDLESFLNVELDNDLSVIILDSLKTNSFSFSNILYETSKGHGITSSEGCFYVLDQDLDFPEDFEQVIFYLGEIETSKMSLGDFIFYLSLISDKYIS